MCGEAESLDGGYVVDFTRLRLGFTSSCPQICDVHFRMPRGIKYGQWAEDEMSRAISAVRNGDMGLNAAAKMYSVPKATLKRHIDGRNNFAVEGKKIIGGLGDIPLEVENQIAEHALKLEACFFGITATDLRRLAYQVAEKNGISNRFNKEKKIAGKKWYSKFMKRHPDLSLRVGRATSMARAVGFNRDRVHEFFDVLEKTIDKYHFEATRIFNVDETGLTTVQKKCRKVVAKKGKNQIGAIASGERGLNTTAVCCVSASGTYVPPMMIFKRVRGKDELKDGAPAGTVFAFNPESGYINKELFITWLEHFIRHVKPSIDDPVLLILDGHSTHTHNLDALEKARENGVHLLCLPAHTTHRLQPLDVSFFKPLSSYYNEEIEKWLRSNPGRCVTQFQIAGIFGKAYAKAATMRTAVNGFAKTGIWPVNRDVFEDHEFAASEVLRPAEAGSSAAQPSTAQIPEAQPLPMPTEIRPSTSRTCNETVEEETDPSESAENSTLPVPIDLISPLPKAYALVTKRVTRGSQKSILLTSSPYQNDLRNKAKKKRKQTLSQSNLGPSKGAVKKRKLSTKKDRSKENREWYCFMCQQSEVDDMIRCLVCSTWVHETCAGVKRGTKRFLCTECIALQEK